MSLLSCWQNSTSVGCGFVAEGVLVFDGILRAPRVQLPLQLPNSRRIVACIERINGPHGRAATVKAAPDKRTMVRAGPADGRGSGRALAAYEGGWVVPGCGSRMGRRRRRWLRIFGRRFRRAADDTLHAYQDRFCRAHSYVDPLRFRRGSILARGDQVATRLDVPSQRPERASPDHFVVDADLGIVDVGRHDDGTEPLGRLGERFFGELSLGLRSRARCAQEGREMRAASTLRHAKLGLAEVLQEGCVRKHRVSLFEGNARRFEITRVEIGRSLVPPDLGLLNFFRRRCGLRPCGSRCDDAERDEEIRVNFSNGRFKNSVGVPARVSRSGILGAAERT